MERSGYSEKEFEETGKHYPTFNTRMGVIGGEPQLKRPITPRENLRLLLENKKPWWIPMWGLSFSDMHEIRPRINPDNVANRQMFDGGPRPDFASLPIKMKGWFDQEWEWVESAGGCTVHPGNPMITDINKWRDVVVFPDLDEIDWDHFAEENKEYMSTDKYQHLGIQCGLWERLMAFMDVGEACIAIIDDDQKEGIHSFFDAYSDFLIEYIERVKAALPHLDGVMIHADWAHERGPFFSPDTAREIIAPYTKKIIDYVHSQDMFYEVHCCGNAEMMIPVFIEMGADLWGGQERVNDMGRYAMEYKNEKFVFAVPAPEFSKTATDEEIDKAAYEWVEEYKDCHVVVRTMNLTTGSRTPQLFLNKVYEYSRKAFQNE